MQHLRGCTVQVGFAGGPVLLQGVHREADEAPEAGQARRVAGHGQLRLALGAQALPPGQSQAPFPVTQAETRPPLPGTFQLFNALFSRCCNKSGKRSGRFPLRMGIQGLPCRAELFEPGLCQGTHVSISAGACEAQRGSAGGQG